jgi:uncharacterized membrane protein
MIQKLSRIYPPIIEAVPLFLIFLVIYLTLSAYPSLPDQIPTHFNFQGIPDDWGSKKTIFLFVGFSAFIYVLITSISAAIAVIHDPKSMINLPDSMKEKLSPSKAEELRAFLVRILWILKVLIMGLFVYLGYSNIQVALNHSEGVGYWPWLFVAALLFVVGVLIFRTFKLALSAG